MSYQTFNNGAAPSTPASGKSTVYTDSADKRFKMIDDRGIITSLGNKELRNFLRNSGFRYAQKQVPATATTYSNTSGRTQIADGFGVTNENASMTYARVDAATPESGLISRYYGTLLKITSTGKIILTQSIFGNDTCVLRGRTVRVQAKVKVPSGTPIINMALVQLTSAGTIDAPPATFISAFGANATDPTLGTNLSYIAPKSGVTNDNCVTDGNHVELTASTSWQRFGAVFDVPSNCKNLFVMIYGDSQFAAAAGFSVSELSLTVGYEIQDWYPGSDAEEYDRLVEYFKTFNVDTGPVQNAGVNTGEFKFPCIVGAAAAFAGIGFRFPKQLRAAPTTNTLYNPSAANAQIRNVTDSADCSGSTITADGESGVWLNGTSSAAAAAGEHLAVHISCEAFM